MGSFLNQASPFLWPLPLHCSCTSPCTHKRSLLYPANLIQCSPMGQERESGVTPLFIASWTAVGSHSTQTNPPRLPLFRPGVRTSIEFPKFESISCLIGQTSGMIGTDIISESLVRSSCLLAPRLDIQNSGSKVNSNVLYACAINDFDFFHEFCPCHMLPAGNSDRLAFDGCAYMLISSIYCMHWSIDWIAMYSELKSFSSTWGVADWTLRIHVLDRRPQDQEHSRSCAAEPKGTFSKKRPSSYIPVQWSHPQECIVSNFDKRERERCL